jgi:hypothetical protein
MQFRGDERGQAIQIGAVLLLGALVISFSLYQAVVVPDQNREIEFNHNQEVQGQLQELRNGLVSTSSGSDGRSVSVQLGTRYPSRIVALNPGPPSGTLRTVDTTDESVNATIANAVAKGEVGDYWDGDNRTYNTGALRYAPVYNEYGNAPVTWYEHSVLFNRFSASNLTLTSQRLIDDDEINLVTLNGSYSASRSGSVSVDVRPVSASSTTVAVTGESSENVTLTLPTRLSRSEWNTLLAGEPNVEGVRVVPVPDADYQLLVVDLDGSVEYDLQATRVGVGTNVVRPEAAYLTDVAGNGSAVPEGGTTQLTVEVRDRLDNPIGGVDVTAGTRRTDSSVSPTGADSDSNGEVTLTYEAPADIDDESQKTDLVNASIDVPASAVEDPDFNASTPLNVTMTVKIDNSDGSGLSSGGGGDSAYSIDWQPETTGQSGFSESGDVYTVDASQTSDVDLRALTDPTAQDAAVDFSLNDSSIASLSPTETTTDSTGEATTTFTPEANGSVAAFVASGGSGDRIDLVVENVAPAGGGFSSLRATSMPPYSSLQRQNITLVPSSDVPATETISINLTDAYQLSPLQVNYGGNANLVRGASNISSKDKNSPSTGRLFVNLTVGSSGLAAGTPVELRLTDIKVGAPSTQTDPYDVTFDRSDTTETGSTTFGIAYEDGLSGLSSTSATDLQSGQSQTQTLSFRVDTDLAGNEQVLLELSDPQSVVVYSSPTVASGDGRIVDENINTDNATAVYAAPSGGLTAGSTVQIDVDADTEPESSSEGTYTVGFSREDEDVAGANYTVGTGPTISSASLVDATDGDGTVADGDSIRIAADVSDPSGVDTVKADASDFGLGTVTLTDGDGDGTYDTTGTVSSGGANGDFDVTVTATDTLGYRSSSTTNTLTLDNDSPTITNAALVDETDGDGAVNGSDSITISADVSDPSGVDTVEADASDFGAGTVTLTQNATGTYTATVGVGSTDMPSADGDYDVTISATDTVGNTASATTNTLTLDTTAPNVFSATLVDATDGDSVVNENDEIRIAVDTTDATSGVNSVTADVSNFGSGTQTLTQNASGVYTVTVTVGQDGMLPADGDYPVDITVDDVADNTQTATTNTLALDTTAPTISNFTLTNPSGKDLRTDFNSSEPLSEIQVSITGGQSITLTTSDFTETQNPDGSYTYTNTTTGVASGDYEATVDVARDAAGNDGAAAQSDTATVPSSADAVRLSGTPSKSPDGETVFFSLENTASSDAIIQNITVVNTTDNRVDTVGNGRKSGSDYIDEGPELQSNRSGSLLDTADPFSIGTTVALNSTSTLSSGEATQYTLAEFRQDNFQERDSGDPVYIRVGLDDGSEKTIELDFP